MSGQLRDIRELMGDSDAYRDELYRRWTGLLSYRYIGRKHSSMKSARPTTPSPSAATCATKRAESWWPRWPFPPRRGVRPTWSPCPIRLSRRYRSSIPATTSNRIEIVGSGIVHQGRTMGYGRCTIVDADNPSGSSPSTRGRARHRHPAGRPGPHGCFGHRAGGRGLARSTAAVAGLRRPARRRPLDAARAEHRTRVAGCRAAHRALSTSSRDRGHRPRRRVAGTKSCRSSAGM